MIVSSSMENPMLRMVGTVRRWLRNAFLTTSPVKVMTRLEWEKPTPGCVEGLLAEEDLLA